MTREELFSLFPRPWALDGGDRDTIVDAKGRAVLQVDPDARLGDADVADVGEAVLALINEAKP